MSPEQAKKPELTPAEAFVEDLKNNYDSTLLIPEVVFEVPPIKTTDQSMASCSNRPEGVYQELRAVVEAGDKLFPITDVVVRLQSDGFRRPDFVDSTLVAKSVSGQRAEIVDISRKRGQLDIGRNPTPNLDLDEQTSKNHFSVIQAFDGTIGIVDHNSIDGIVVYTQKMTDNPNKIRPIGHDVWSVKSAKLKAAIESSKN